MGKRLEYAIQLPPCPNCQKNDQVRKDPCPYCDGTRLVCDRCNYVVKEHWRLRG